MGAAGAGVHPHGCGGREGRAGEGAGPYGSIPRSMAVVGVHTVGVAALGDPSFAIAADPSFANAQAAETDAGA